MSSIEPLYERFGGLAAVAQLVFAFYDRVLRSQRLARYFADVDMDRLIDHQTQFLAAAMGGPPSFSDAHLRQVHARLKVSDDAFDEMMQHLEDTLRAFGMAEQDMQQVLRDLDAHRTEVVHSSEAEADAPSD